MLITFCHLVYLLISLFLYEVSIVIYGHSAEAGGIVAGKRALEVDRKTWIQIQAHHLLTSHVTLDKLFHFMKPLLPHLKILISQVGVPGLKKKISNICQVYKQRGKRKVPDWASFPLAETNTR